MDYSIMIIDDDKNFLETLGRGLRISGFKNCILEDDPQKAAQLFQQHKITVDVALIDILMPKLDGVELLTIIRNHSPDTECIMITASNEASIAVKCLKLGAFDYLLKPVTQDELILSIKKALERITFLKSKEISMGLTTPVLKNPEAFQHIVTRSKRMLRILKEAELHAPSCVPILITGESGTGKELLARGIHLASNRRNQPFLAVNITAMQDHLFESEFFGHVKGAFTGAIKDRKGHLETVGNGTIFLDEIGDLPLNLQSKLLRVLQDGEYIKLGSSIPKRANCRFIAATNADLEYLKDKGKIRPDFFYRLKGAWLHLPPLRERKDDIPLLVHHFLKESSKNGTKPTIDDSAMEALKAYDYPGNIRELRSIIEVAVNLCSGRTITLKCLPEAVKRAERVPFSQMPRNDQSPLFIRPLREIEREHILKAYEITGHNKSQTARLLKIGLNTLRRRLREYQID